MSIIGVFLLVVLVIVLVACACYGAVYHIWRIFDEAVCRPLTLRCALVHITGAVMSIAIPMTILIELSVLMGNVTVR